MSRAEPPREQAQTAFGPSAFLNGLDLQEIRLRQQAYKPSGPKSADPKSNNMLKSQPVMQAVDVFAAVTMAAVQTKPDIDTQSVSTVVTSRSVQMKQHKA